MDINIYIDNGKNKHTAQQKEFFSGKEDEKT